MVFNNSFLIVEVKPANNETSVPINTVVSVRFMEAMQADTITSGTLMLSKVNGAAIATTVTYDAATKTAFITPSADLEQSTQYRLVVASGTNGVLTITGNYLPENKSYEFTTTYETIVSPPTSITVGTNGASISWLQPDQYDPTLPLKYEAAISTSALDPTADSGAVLWPLEQDAVGDIDGTTVTVAKKLSDGAYYAYVRAKSIDTTSGTIVSTSDWASTQFTVTTSSSGGTTDPGTGGSTVFEVSATYPKTDAVNTTPDSIKILFTSNLDFTTVTAQTVYVIKAQKPTSLNAIDLMTDFDPSKAIAITIDTPTAQNIISLTVPTTIDSSGNVVSTLSDNTEYTVIVREGIKDVDSNALGEAYFWSFTTQLDPLYGDAERIREDIGSFVTGLSDKVLYKYMHDASQIAYDIVSNQTTFNAKTFDADIPHYVKEYVRFQTGYDLLVNAFLAKSSSLGSTRTLGDLSIATSSSVNPTAILSQFKERIKPWLDQLHGLHNRGYAKPDVAVKGENIETYPDFFDRTTLKDINA